MITLVLTDRLNQAKPLHLFDVELAAMVPGRAQSQRIEVTSDIPADRREAALDDFS